MHVNVYVNLNIVTLPRLPPTHLDYSCVESLDDQRSDVSMPGSLGVAVLGCLEIRKSDKFWVIGSLKSLDVWLLG